MRSAAFELGPLPQNGAFLGRLLNVASSERHRLEDFLTEVWGEILGRLSSSELSAFFRNFFLEDLVTESRSRWLNAMRSCESVVVRTQVRIPVHGTIKKPDIVVFGDGAPLAIIECKVGAGFTSSTVDSRGEGTKTVEQLESYASWLQEQGGSDTALILLTQYSAPPPDFFSHSRFKVDLRAVRRWSDLHRFLRENLSPASQKYGINTQLVRDFVGFLEETELMLDDVRSTDFAAASLYLGTQSHLRMTSCVNEASARIRPYLKKKGVHKFSKPGAHLETDIDTMLLDTGWNDTIAIGWGFWFCSSHPSEWNSRYEPTWTLTEGVMVYARLLGKKAIVRPRSFRNASWYFANSLKAEEPYTYKVCSLTDFVGDKDSSMKIARWLEESVREAIDLLGKIKAAA